MDHPRNDKEELERRLAQARRMAAQYADTLTTSRLNKLVRDLEEQLQKPE
jgi:hypothetical protein